MSALLSQPHITMARRPRVLPLALLASLLLHLGLFGLPGSRPHLPAPAGGPLSIRIMEHTTEVQAPAAPKPAPEKASQAAPAKTLEQTSAKAEPRRAVLPVRHRPERTPAPASPPMAQAPAGQVPPQGQRTATQAEPAPTTPSRHEAVAVDTAAVLNAARLRLQQHFRYPLLARRRGWQGEVLLGFQLSARGQITDIRVARSSGYPLLDRAAVNSLRQVGSLPTPRQRLDLQLPVIYRLEG